jgi:hypothetical protein
MTTIFHIAKNTWRECLRQPIFVITLICTLTIIGLYPTNALFVFRSQQKLVTDGSLATIMLFGLITAVLCSSHTVSHEINSGTVLLILSKPVSRDSFIIAKILGILAAMTLFSVTAAIAVLIALKSATDQFRFDPYLVGGVFVVILVALIVGAAVNYYGRRSFASACAKSLFVGMVVFGIIAFFMPEWSSVRHDWAHGSSYFDANVAREVLLIIFAVWAMSTMATALSTRFNLMSNMTICMVVFIMGLMSDWIRVGLVTMQLSDIQKMMHSWYYLFFPTILLFWVISIKRFSHRKNTKVSVVEVHGVFGILFISIVAKAISDHIAHVQLSPTSAWMNAVAGALFKVKSVVSEVVYAAIPNWQQFWLADAIAGNKTIPNEYIGSALVYVGMFMASFALLAMLMFSDRDIGSQEAS